PAATDSTRVLRLPGFINRKYKTDFRVQAEKHTDRIHHLQDFRLHTEPIDNNFRAHYRLLTQRSSETRPLSQSEHDWIYAKRALARGDDPEEIIRDPADDFFGVVAAGEGPLRIDPIVLGLAQGSRFRRP